MNGTLGDLWLVASSEEKARHRRHAVNHAFVHAHVDHVRAVLDLLARDADGFFVLCLFDQLGKTWAEPATFVRSPIIMYTPFCCVKGCVARESQGRQSASATGAGIDTIFRVSSLSDDLTRRATIERLGDRANVLGRVAAATARDVDQAGIRKFAEKTAPYRAARDRSRSRQRIGQAPRSGSKKSPRPPFADSSLKNGYIKSGPSEQLSPIDSGFTCATAFHNASTVCAEIIVSPPQPDGRRNHDR